MYNARKSIRLSVSLSVCLSIRPSVSLSIRLSVSLSVCLSFCLSVCLSLSLSLSLSSPVCLCVYVYLMSVCHAEVGIPAEFSVNNRASLFNSKVSLQRAPLINLLEFFSKTKML